MQELISINQSSEISPSSSSSSSSEYFVILIKLAIMKNVATFFLLCWTILLLEHQCRSEIFAETPGVKTSATRGMMIDAGSGGSRIHIYNWKPRKFTTLPPPLSFPEDNEQSIGHMDGGVQGYADNPERVSEHLAPLIDFAKASLMGLEKEFQDFPIYIKATGGMREVEESKRDRLMDYVRQYLSDPIFCPFFFRDDFARIISGEEEAIFSWATTNFLMGTLIPSSEGLGIVHDKDLNSTFGTVDLGGSSTQIAFFVPSQDILEGLYPLQLGGQKRWNVYTKSFLKFGIESARKRHQQGLVEYYKEQLKSPNQLGSNPVVVNPCFPMGYSEMLFDVATQVYFTLTGPISLTSEQYFECRQSIFPLLETQYGAFCKEVFHDQCSISGAYQPSLPNGKHGNFIGTSSYLYSWKFLQMPTTAPLTLFEEKSISICQQNYSYLQRYFKENFYQTDDDYVKLFGYLPYYCFLSAYSATLLEDGYHFQKNQTLTVVQEVKGHKVGWALGAMLYELNNMPWELEVSVFSNNPWSFIFAGLFLGLIVGAGVGVLSYMEYLASKLEAEYDEEMERSMRLGNQYFLRNARSGGGSQEFSAALLELTSHQQNYNSGRFSRATSSRSINSESYGAVPTVE